MIIKEVIVSECFNLIIPHTKDINVDNELFQAIRRETVVQQTIHTLFFNTIDVVKATKRPPHQINYTSATAIKENSQIEVFVALERALIAQTNHASIFKVRTLIF